MDEDTETPEPLEEYLESINRKISRTQDTFVQFYCRSSNSNYTSLAEELCSCLPVLKDAKITHIPETITSKEQMGWIADQITKKAFDKFNGSYAKWVGNFCEVLHSDQLSSEKRSAVTEAIHALFETDENMGISGDFLMENISRKYGSGQDTIDAFQGELSDAMGENYPPVLSQSQFNKGQNKVFPVFVNGFANEIKKLIPTVKADGISYLQAYYAHIQCQGRTLETSAYANTDKQVVYNFLSESGLKIVVFNVIAPEDTVVSVDGKSVDPSDLAYCSALQSHFSTTIPENYTCELEKRILANLTSQNTQGH
jgi:hypothetical protein